MRFWLPLSPCSLLSITLFFSLIKEKKDQEFGANQLMDGSWVRLVHQTKKNILAYIPIIFII